MNWYAEERKGETMKKDEKKRMCRGCRDDFYNHGNNSDTGECWMLAKARVVERVAVGTWQEPPYTWIPLKVLSCYHRDGTHYLPKDDCRVVMPKKSD